MTPKTVAPPGSSVHGILQERILEWVDISFSRGTSSSTDWTHASTLASMLLISTLMSFAKTSTNKGETDARSLCRERGAFQEAQGWIRNDRDIIQQVGWPGPCPFYASAGHPAPEVGEYSREGRRDSDCLCVLLFLGAVLSHLEVKLED